MPIAARFSLRTSLFLLLALVAVLAGTKQFVTILGDRTRSVEAAEARLLDRALRSTEREEHLFQEVGFVLRQLARQPADDAAPNECSAALLALAGDFAWLKSISLVSVEGSFTCSSLDSAGTLGSIAGHDYFRTALRTGDLVISDFVVGRIDGLPAVVAAIPRIEGGVVRDVVLAGIDVDELSLVAADAGDDADGTLVALLDRNAFVVASSPEGSIFTPGQDLSATDLWAATAGGAGVLPAVAFGGRTYVVSFSALSATNGRLVVLRDRSIVLAEANARAVRSVAAMVIVVIALCLIFWLGGEWLVHRPLAAMRSAAGRVASGGLARIDVTGFVPEFRQLGESFNSMSEALAERDAELNAANLRLAELALRDGLTDLGNRRAFEERIEQEGERCARDRKVLSLLLIDVDRFKQFNDHYGHFAGDDTLRRVAALVAAAARRASDFAARIGGEEFALILPNCPQDEAMTIARQLVADVAALRIAHAGSEEGIVTVSVGVAGHRMVPGVAVRGLLESADQSLYTAKRQGRNNAVGGPEVITLVS